MMLVRIAVLSHLWLALLALNLDLSGAAGCGSQILSNTDLNGHDLQPFRARDSSSATDCCSMCENMTTCSFWTFMPPRTCYLKNSAAGRRTMQGYSSGCSGAGCSVPPAPPPSPKPGPGYHCDDQGGERGVCINGGGPYPNSSCGGECGKPAKACSTDWDCSLAGVCTNGACLCDPWTSGSDCSYLNFKPVDRGAMGYLDPNHSSWGGNAVLGKDGKYHLFMAEIGCKDPSKTRCGLGGWTSVSQIGHAVSDKPDGPYKRMALVAPPEHHNPTIKVSPVDGSWNIYSIKAGSGPIVVTTSTDQGNTWTGTTPGTVVSNEQNPGPIFNSNGSLIMFYRDSSSQVTSPCSSESIGVQYCQSFNSTCSEGRNPIYSHTSEDPSVFIDHRGNWHMLINAFPGGCQPKLQQGGHAWSKDGITWSEPRGGAYNTTIQFTDGTNMTCVRRERPQMVLDENGMPLVMFAGVTGCPTIPNTDYKGGSDCFTLAQLMEQ